MDIESFRLAVELRDRLFTELRQNPLFRAYLSAQETVAALSAGSSNLKPPQEQTERGKNTKQSPLRQGTQTEAILTSATAYVRDKGARAPSSEIAKALLAKGILIGGKDP